MPAISGNPSTKTRMNEAKAAGLAMAFKLIEAAQERWRAVNAPHLVALVRAGVDVLARWFEQHLFDLVDARGDLDADCVVVNRAGRVVAPEHLLRDRGRDLPGTRRPAAARRW